MLLARPTGRIVAGVVLAVLGIVWTLQGLDLLGQDGGMNDRPEWVVIGLVAVAVGAALAVSGFRARRRM